MDRLICGGYGKAEVAIRAAFKAVIAGKQVAILIPTTVLCQQHQLSFKERFSNSLSVLKVLAVLFIATQQANFNRFIER